MCSSKIHQYANQSEAKEMSELTHEYPALEVVVSSLLVGWFSVVALVVFTWVKAHEVVNNREHLNRLPEIDIKDPENTGNEFATLYSTIPNEYMVQHVVTPPLSRSSICSSIEQIEDQEAIDTVMEVMVNPSISRKGSNESRKSSLHLEDAISIIQGRRSRHTSCLSLPRRSLDLLQSRHFSRRSASVFEGMFEGSGQSLTREEQE